MELMAVPTRIGLVTSLMWMVCVTSSLLPQASVKIHLRIIVESQAEPEPCSEYTGWMLPLQLSVAVGTGTAGMSFTHCTLISLSNPAVIAGFWAWFTVMI